MEPAAEWEGKGGGAGAAEGWGWGKGTPHEEMGAKSDHRVQSVIIKPHDL